MFGALTSLTGGGGLSASSSAAASTGDQGIGSFNAGGINFGNKSNKNLLILGGVLGLVAIVFIIKK